MVVSPQSLTTIHLSLIFGFYENKVMLIGGGHISNRSIRRKNLSNLALLPSFRAPKRRKL